MHFYNLILSILFLLCVTTCEGLKCRAESSNGKAKFYINDEQVSKDKFCDKDSSPCVNSFEKQCEENSAISSSLHFGALIIACGALML